MNLSPIRRVLVAWPCSICGEPTPSAFRLERDHGSVICADCKPLEDLPEASGHVLHGNLQAVGIA